MTGLEYMLTEVMEPHLFVIRKQKRDAPDKSTPMLTYYVLDGSIYQAPHLSNVFAARIVSLLFLSSLSCIFVFSIPIFSEVEMSLIIWSWLMDEASDMMDNNLSYKVFL